MRCTFATLHTHVNHILGLDVNHAFVSAPHARTASALLLAYLLRENAGTHATTFFARMNTPHDDETAAMTHQPTPNANVPLVPDALEGHGAVPVAPADQVVPNTPDAEMRTLHILRTRIAIDFAYIEQRVVGEPHKLRVALRVLLRRLLHVPENGDHWHQILGILVPHTN